MPIDLAFIVDSSGSISSKNWQKMKDFLKAIVDEFNIGPASTHVAIVAYSTAARIVLKFGDLRGSLLTNDAVKLKIDTMEQQRGLTYIDKAIRLAERSVLTEASGMRSNVPKVSV